jgi:hypothetical protein
MTNHPIESCLGNGINLRMQVKKKTSYTLNWNVSAFQGSVCIVPPWQIKFGFNPRIKIERSNGLKVVAMLFTSDGQERFYNKELQKRQFEYHRGGKLRPARPVPMDALKVIMFQVITT